MQYLTLGRRILSALAVFCGSFAFATDYYVSTTGSDANNGLSSETAVATIDKAISLATTKDDTIHVAPGTYQTTTQWGPNLLATMVGTGTSRDEVVIESSGANRTLRMAADSVVRHLTLVGNKDYKADKGGAVEMSGGLLEDCVIKDGTANNSSNPGGGNVYLNGGTVRNCLITGGKAKRRGGNVYLENGTVENCEIRDGYSENEAGNLYLAYGLVSKCTIADASALGDGANVRTYDNANGQIVDCVISGGKILAVQGDDGKWPERKGANAFIRGSVKVTRCQFLGGSYSENGYSCGSLTLYYPGNGTVVEDCLIKDSDCGGALLVGSTYIYNTTIVDNEQYGVWSWGSGKTFYNTILYGNVLAGVSKDWAGDKPSKNVFGLAVTSGGVFKSGDYSNGIILLENSDAFVDYEKGDYHLKGSVLVDVGTTDPRTDVSATDLDGNPRVINQVDIGCYEYQPTVFSVIFSMSYDTNDHIPAQARFTAQPLNADGAVTYTWDFGDGSERVTTTETTVTHTFETAGKFTVTLTAESAGETTQQTRKELAVIYDTFVWVSPTGTATFPYNTLETGFRAIDSAMSVHASVGGGEIRVAPGTYETAWQYNLDKDYVVKGMGKSPEDVVIRNTTKADKSNTYRRVFHVASAGARVENLTMENGSVLNNNGAVLRVAQGMVSNCVIRGGRAVVSGNGPAAGGGVELSNAGILTHCVVSNNVVEGTSSNTGLAAGGGIFFSNGAKNAKLLNCLIAYNRYIPSATVEGAAGVRYGGSNDNSLMENCTIVSNVVEGSLKDDSAGLYCTSWYTPMRNNVIAGNYETEKGECTSMVLGYDARGPIKVYNLVVGENVTNDGTKNYADSIVLGDVKTMFKDFENGNFMPKTGSVLANQGSTPNWPCEVDLAGKPRVFGKAIDIGCYEVQKNNGLTIIIR